MGNGLQKKAKDDQETSAIAALSTVMKLNQTDLFKLRSELFDLANASAEFTASPYFISRWQFLSSMRKVGKLHSALDEEILDRLFTMFDVAGNDRIEPLPLLIGISPLALIGDDREKLIFAMEVGDADGTGCLRVMEMFKIFQSKFTNGFLLANYY